MTEHSDVHNPESKYNYPTYGKYIHLGMALFGIAAFLTGELAEEGYQSTGYLVHAYLGLSLAAIILSRVVVGCGNSLTMSFRGWSPFSKQQRNLAIEDFRMLLKLKVPKRDNHQGLAGLTQMLGLIVFSWMSVTGTALYLLNGPVETRLFEILEELHEVGESLIPIYLLLHVGAVILHGMGGDNIWKKMFSFRSVD